MFFSAFKALMCRISTHIKIKVSESFLKCFVHIGALKNDGLNNVGMMIDTKRII